METLSKTRLFFLLEESTRDSIKQTTERSWQQAWKKFIDRIEELTVNNCCPALWRALNYAYVELECIESKLKEKSPTNNTPIIYCTKAMGMIRCELHILTLKLDHPLFLAEKERIRSPLYLADEYTLTDLVEIIASLYEITFFREEARSKARLQTIIHVFEWAFNVSLDNYNMLRCSALNYRNNPTSFIDRLRKTLITLSEK